MGDGGSPIGLIVSVVLSLCCCIVFLAAVGGGIFWFVRGRKPKDGGASMAANTPAMSPPAPTPPSSPAPSVSPAPSSGGGIMNQALSGMGMPQVPFVPDNVRTAVLAMAEGKYGVKVEQQRILLTAEMPPEALADGTTKAHRYELQLSFDPNTKSTWLTDFDNGAAKAERIMRNYMTPAGESYSFDNDELKAALRPLLAEAGWPANN